MKTMIFIFLLSSLFIKIGFSQNTFRTNTDKKVETTVVNDTMKVKVVDGRIIKRVYKLTDGKTITIREMNYTQSSKSFDISFQKGQATAL